MTFLIGSFPAGEYQFYLYPPSKKPKNWRNYFNLIYPNLIVLINRLAYFILSRFSTYPDHVYLFQKFKSHQFSRISTYQEYQTVNKIFKLFKGYADLNASELDRIKKELKEVRGALNANLTPHKLAGKSEGNKGLKEQAAKQVTFLVKKEANQPSEALELAQQFFLNEEGDSSESSKSDFEQQEEEVVEQVSENAINEESFFSEPESSSPAQSEQEEDIVKEFEQDVKEELDFSDSSDSNPEEGVSEQLVEQEQEKDFVGVSEESAAPLEKEDSQESSKEEDEQPKILRFQEIDIPENLRLMISSLPLQHQSIASLESRQADAYWKSLQPLLNLENQLCMQNLQIKMPWRQQFEDYLLQANDAFQTTLLEARKKAAEIHVAFRKTFSDHLPEIKEGGIVHCTIEQLDWALSKLRDRFPALYRVAFDAPSLSIYQTIQITRLMQLILTGWENKDASLCCVLIRETVHHKPRVIEKRQNDSDKAGSKRESYIFSQWRSFIDGTKQGSQQAFNDTFSRLINSYITDWLECPGSYLSIGEESLSSGLATEWVSYVRDQYTEFLKELEPEKLKKEIESLIYCPLITLIIQMYADKIENRAWRTSLFPEALMREMFESALQTKRQNHAAICEAIQKTIKNTSFLDLEEIEHLAKKGGCSVEHIEPLIRIRVLYILICLSQHVMDPIMAKMNQRAHIMRDSGVCKNSNETLLTAESPRRVLVFDKSLDQFTLTAVIHFQSSHQNRLVAQGIAKWHVSSLSQSGSERVVTEFTDLHNLQLSPYISEAEARYLVAQVAPQTLLKNIKMLSEKTSQLLLVKKSKKYHQQKEAHAKQQSFWSKTPFDLRGYEAQMQDSFSLDEAIKIVQILANDLNIHQSLVHYCEWTDELDQEFDSHVGEIRKDLEAAASMLMNLYHLINVDSLIRKKMKVFEDLLTVCVLSSGGSDLEDPGVLVEKEMDVGFQKEIERELRKEETLFEGALDYLMQESSEEKDIRWKIERYEELTQNAQQAIIDYCSGSSIELNKILLNPYPEDWQKRLMPIFQFSCKILNMSSQRWTQSYLRNIRNIYVSDFLDQLRQAAEWAKQNPSATGVEHVNALCYQLYTTVNLNGCCQKIFDTFIQLGKIEGKKSSSVHLEMPLRYALINGLFPAYESIKAVPGSAKAPLLSQLANSAKGHLGGFLGLVSFDPNRQSNPIHVLYHKKISVQKTNKSEVREAIKDIAMGSPTIESGNGIVEINPEFQGFLRHCQAHKKSHLYINNQNFIPQAWLKGDESKRCQTLHNLAETEFKETLFVITLSQNSTFYYQIGHHLNSLNIKEVKEAIVAQLLDGHSKEMRHYLPSDLVSQPQIRAWIVKTVDDIHRDSYQNCSNFIDENIRNEFVQHFHHKLRRYIEEQLELLPDADGKEWGYSIYDKSAKRFMEEFIKQVFDASPQETGNMIPSYLMDRFHLREWSVQAINKIHECLFGARKELTVQERRIFIRLFYQNLSRKILIDTRVDSYNVSCKDRIDRGAVSDAEDYAYLAILTNRMNEDRVVKFFKTLVFSRAIIVRKRAMIQERLERLVETVKFMIDHQDQLKSLHQQLFSGVEITIDQ